MTTSAVTLVAVDRRSATPLYRQIYQAFRTRILAGELRAGDPVPSTRDLARELSVSRIPVLGAYEQLLAEGYFQTRKGAGTFVASSLSDRGPPPRPMRGQRPISARAAALPPYERPTWTRLGPFQLGQPELRSFPIRTWSRLVARYSRNVPVRALQYGEAMGLPELREAIAAYLRTARGARCDADQIVIVSGSQQGLDLSARVLLDTESAVWMEEPGYWLARQVLAAAGCRVVPVPVDGEGLDVAAGIRLERTARAALVAPSHQSPLGVTMSAARRLRLLDWAQRAGAWIVEDDYDSEYRYDSKPIASLQGLDANSRVVYVGTFSKVMFPSLRLGYLVVPRDLVERFAAMRRAIDLCPPHLPQAVMAEFISEGHFARHIHRMRPIYQARREALVAAIDAEFGARAEVIGSEAGMHVTVLLDGCRDDTALAMRAARQSILVSPLSAAYAGGSARQGLVLGFGNTDVSRIAPAVRQLRRLASA